MHMYLKQFHVLTYTCLALVCVCIMQVLNSTFHTAPSLFVYFFCESVLSTPIPHCHIYMCIIGLESFGEELFRVSYLNVTYHNPVCLTLEQGYSEVTYLHNDPLNNWQTCVTVLLVDHFNTEHWESLTSEPSSCQCIGAGGHEAEQHSIKSAAVCVTVYSACPSSRNPTGASLRTTDLAHRALRGGAGELANRTVAAGGLICP